MTAQHLELAALPFPIRNGYKHWYGLLYDYPYDDTGVFAPLVRYQVLAHVISKSLGLIENNGSAGSAARLSSRDLINLETQVSRYFDAIRAEEFEIAKNTQFAHFLDAHNNSNNYRAGRYLLSAVIVPLCGTIIELFTSYSDVDVAVDSDDVLYASSDTAGLAAMKQLGKLLTDCSFFLELLLFSWQDYSNDEIAKGDGGFEDSKDKEDSKDMKNNGECSSNNEHEHAAAVQSTDISSTANKSTANKSTTSKEINLKNIQDIYDAQDEDEEEEIEGLEDQRKDISLQDDQNTLLYDLPNFQQGANVSKLQIKKLVKETRLAGVKILQNLNEASKRESPQNDEAQLASKFELFMITDSVINSMIIDISQLYRDNCECSSNENDEDAEEINNLIARIMKEEEEHSTKRQEMDELFPSLPTGRKKKDGTRSGEKPTIGTTEDSIDKSHSENEEPKTSSGADEPENSFDAEELENMSNAEEPENMSNAEEPESVSSTDKPAGKDRVKKADEQVAMDIPTLMTRQEQVSEIKKKCKFAINSADYEDFEGCLRFLSEASELVKKAIAGP